jgi:hypothetical protein
MEYGVTEMVAKSYESPGRLPFLIGLIQAMSVRTDYEATLDEWWCRFPTIKRDQLETIFAEHPEFFRCPDGKETKGYSLIYRRFLPDNKQGKRPRLEPEQTKMLIDVAVNLYSAQFERSRDWRFWWSLLATAFAGFLGVVITSVFTK